MGFLPWGFFILHEDSRKHRKAQQNTDSSHSGASSRHAHCDVFTFGFRGVPGGSRVWWNVPGAGVPGMRGGGKVGLI